MNTRILLNVLFVFLLASCSKDAEIVNELDREISNHAKTAATIPHSMMCGLEDADVEIIPVCSFDPSNFSQIPFPVYVYLNGERIPFEGYSYEWGTGSHGSAISVTYNQLPISLLLTEDDTDCQVVLTLDESFWGKESDISVTPVTIYTRPTSLSLPEDFVDGGMNDVDNQDL